MFTAEETTDKPAPAATDLRVRFARWITQITPACAATASLHAIRAWWNVKSTDGPAHGGASNSPSASFHGFWPMTIISLKTEAAGELNRIGLSDGSLFSFRICYLPPEITVNNDIAEGKEINAVEEEAFRFAAECLRAEKTALRLIARAEQCSPGLMRKLQKRKFTAACAGAVISRLCELKLVDDRRFARLWLESRLRLARSPRRLLSSLCGHGIDRDDAEAALKAVLNEEETELALLTRFLKRRPRKAGRGEEGERSLKYLLKSEGFSPQAITRFLDKE